jgi:hypothetical protein
MSAEVEAESVAGLRALRPEVFSGAGGVVVLPDGVFYNYRRDVVALVNKTICPRSIPSATMPTTVA